MNKELDALRKIEDFIVNIYDDFGIKHEECRDTRNYIRHSFNINIIEAELKRLEIYENHGIDLDETDDVEKAIKLNAEITIADKVMNTQERLLTSISSDEIRILSSVLNSQIKKLKNKLKALEIIKEKGVLSVYLDFYGCHLVVNNTVFDITPEEYKLLKEVLL